jgi:hypothetical protein
MSDLTQLSKGCPSTSKERISSTFQVYSNTDGSVLLCSELGEE